METRLQFRHWPRALLAALVIVSIVEGYIQSRALDFGTDWSTDRQWTSRAVQTAREVIARGAVLCFGDSHIKFGVVPAILSDRIGALSFNLAMQGAQPEESYYLLVRALRRGARPRAVILHFQPFLLAQRLQTRLRPYTELLEPGECLDLAWSARDAVFFGEILARRMLPSLRARDEIKAIVLHGTDRSQRWRLPALTRNWKKNSGAQVMPEGPLLAFDFERIPQFASRFHCDPIAETYLHRFLDLAATHNIDTYYVLPPVDPAIQVGTERIGFDGAAVAFVRALLSRHKKI